MTLDFSVEKDTVLVGFKGGQMMIFDCAFGVVVKTISTRGSQILFSKFYPKDKSNFVSGDADGRIYLYSLTRYVLTYNVDKRLLIDNKGVSPYFCCS